MKKERTRKRKQKPRNHRIPLFQIPAIASHFPLVHLWYTLYLLVCYQVYYWKQEVSIKHL